MQSSPPKLGLAEAKNRSENVGFSLFKLVIDNFFTADYITKFIRSLDQKKAIFELEKLIKEEIPSIWWSNPSSFNITLLSLEYSNPLFYYNNNNQWCSVVYRVLDQRRLFWHTKEKFRDTKRSWVFLMFLEGVKITSVGLKLDRPQLQHWLLFLEHNTINRLRSKDLMLSQAYLWTMTVFMIQFETLPVLLILSNAGSS